MDGADRPLLRVVGNDEFLRKQALEVEAARPQAQVLTRLAAHLLQRWETARVAKAEPEGRMKQALRQRKGLYEPEQLQAIKEQGGSELFMLLTSVKCRAATSWLRDAITGQGSEKPWTASETPRSDLPNELEDQLMRAIGQEVGAMTAAGSPPPADMVEERVTAAREMLRRRLQEIARSKAQATENELEDALLEGGFMQALDQGVDDLVTYPAMIIKGPVPRMKARMKWQQGDDGWQPVVTQELVKTYHRVDPFNLYPASWATNIDDGDLFELHELTPSSLYDLIGSPGYDEKAIREVLTACEHGTAYTDWAGLGRTTARDISQPHGMWAVDRPVQALEYWGQVSGKLLVEWGMDAQEVPDLQRLYDVNCWLIAGHVIRATINIDPLGAKPYSKASYEEIPGAFWGNGVPDLIRDQQQACNAAARAMINNMGMASGPMVWMNVDRMPPGAKVTQLYPWKIFQGTSDPMGSTAPPIEFFQPNAQTQQLMEVYKFFSDLADEASGIPKYLTGDGRVGGAGRTSSGLSMLMGNATKLMKQVLGGVDRVLEGTLQRTHTFMMRFEPRDELQGDIRIVARGVNSVAARETMQLRRNEFLGMTANPIDLQIMGPKGRAYLLREQARLLGMNTDELVPDPDAAQAPPPGQPGQPGQPANGEVPGQPGMAGTGQPAQPGMRPEGALADRMSV